MTARCQSPTCNRELRTEESRRRGYGPVCYRRKFGAPPPAPSRTQVSVPAHIAPDHPVDPNQIPLPLETPVNEPKTFRKKPVEIQAMQLLGDEDGSSGRAVAEWCGGRVIGTFAKPHLDIDTLEGVMCAEVGAWIIRGVQGEFYPCKPDIFEATYDPA